MNDPLRQAPFKYVPPLASATNDPTLLVVPTPEILLGKFIPVKVPDGLGGETAGDAGVNLAMTRVTYPEGVAVLLPPWSNMSVGDTYFLFWGSFDPAPAFTGYVEPEEVNQPLICIVPLAYIIGTQPNEPHVDSVRYEVVRQGSGNQDASPTIQVLVKLTLPGGRDPDAGTPGHQGLALPRVSKNPINDPSDRDGVDVTIAPYTFMRTYDVITLAWGNVSIEHTVTADEAGRDVVIHVTREQIDSAGDSNALPVVYKVKDEVLNPSNDADNRPWSAATLVEVEVDPSRPIAPYFDQFPTNIIDAGRLGSNGLDIRLYLTPGTFQDGDQLRVTWAATAIDGSPLTPFTGTHDVVLGNGLTPLILTVPTAEVLKATEGRAKVTYVLQRTGSPDKTSKSLNGTIVGGVERLPAPVVDEAVDGVIAPTQDFATIRIAAYDGFKAGDKVLISWTGTTAAGLPISDISQREVSDAEENAGVLTRQVANDKIQPLAGQPVTVIYDVNTLRQSEALTLHVANQGVDPVFPAPRVLQANNNNVLNPLDARNGARVEVRYDTMQTTDTITLRWVGSPGAGTPTIPSQPGNSATRLVTFTVPDSAVGAGIGKGVNVSYTIRTHTGATHASSNLSLSISPIDDSALPAPQLPIAANDILNLDTLEVDPIITVATWPFIAVDQRLWLEMTGQVNGQSVTRRLLQGTGVTDAQTITGLNHPVPRAQFLDLDNDSNLTIHLKVNFDAVTDAPEGQALPFPSSRVIHVTRNIRTLARVTLPKAYRREETRQYLNIEDLYRDEFLEIQVPLATALPSDTFELTWQGRVSWRSGSLPVQTPGVKTVLLPRTEFVDIIGSQASISYTVTDTLGTVFNSLTLTASVDPYLLDLVPPTISGHDIRVQYSGQNNRHTAVVSAFVEGETAWSSAPPQNMPNDPNTRLTVTLPSTWYDQHRGRLVFINYSVALNDGSSPALKFSRYLRVTLR